MSAVVLLALMGSVAFTLPDNQADINVLVFSKTSGYRHQSIEAGKVALLKMGQERAFEVTITEDAALFNDATLQNFNVIIFLSTTQDVLNEEQEQAMMRFIQAGGGYVGIHAAADTEYEWEWYGGLVGGYFAGHPNNPNVREATLSVVNSEHSSTRMLPETWRRSDEWYDYRSVAEDRVPLIMIDETEYKGENEEPAAELRPIAWYHDYNGGRAFYTGLGHTEESFSEQFFLDHLYGGIIYAAGN